MISRATLESARRDADREDVCATLPFATLRRLANGGTLGSVKKLMLSAAALVTGCAAMMSRTDAASLQKFDDMSDCARQAEENPLRANCSERFKDTVLTGELEALKVVPEGTYISLKARSDGSHMSCWLDGPQDQAQLASLSAGDMATIKATPHARTVRRNVMGDVVWTTIELRPCALVSVKKGSS